MPPLFMAMLLAAATLFPASVEAHAVLVGSAPPKRAVLRDPPKQLELWFNERLEPSFASITVLDAGGTAVDAGPAVVGQDDRKRLVLGLPPLRPGTYRVRFRVLSVDGHVAEDSFSFSVRQGGR
jgi:methionine-rich copper-binding protein CopC